MPLLEDTHAQLGGFLLAVSAALGALALGPAWPNALIAGGAGASMGLLIGRLFGQWRGKNVALRERASNGNSIALGAGAFDVISVLDVPAFVIGSLGTIQTHNRHARLLFPEIRDGRPLYQVSRHPGLLEPVQRARELHRTQTGEITERAQGGRRLLATVTPLETAPGAEPAGDAGSSPFLLVQFRDLSEQDRLAQLRSDFIANASHELRTPLASLTGFIETLQGPASGDAAARDRFLTIMAGQTSRMARILDDLLLLSRIEVRAHVTPTGNVDAGRIVLSAVDGLEPIAREAKIALNFEESPEPYIVKGDRDELEQVFQNLIQNAIKYGREGGRVDVAIRRAPSRTGGAGDIIVAITDDGPGIAEEHLPRLTERFYRVDTATSRAKGGTGLGLAIVKHILNRHHGELEIASQIGKGSTFSVVLRPVPAHDSLEA